MQLIHNRSCPRRNCRPKPLLNTKCLTSFKKINLNKVKHASDGGLAAGPSLLFFASGEKKEARRLPRRPLRRTPRQISIFGVCSRERIGSFGSGLVCETRGCLKNATNSQQVVSTSDLPYFFRLGRKKWTGQAASEGGPWRRSGAWRPHWASKGDPDSQMSSKTCASAYVSVTF